ncbi:hypothetical protein ECFDA504_2928, partial [Escherichia coli FDA504]
DNDDSLRKTEITLLWQSMVPGASR